MVLMDAPQPQRSRIHADSRHDYITSLPPNLKETILLKLPIKDAVRTSILLRKWMDSWVTIPNLVFEQKDGTESELIKVVDVVLLQHRGPIQQFKLHSDRGCGETIGRWLLVLSANGIKDIELFQFEGNIPSRLASCILLERLCLFNCWIKFPSSFQGFKKLRTLILTNCNLPGISLDNLDSGCPLLHHLVLRMIRGLQGCFRICASNLASLEIFDTFHDICLEAPKLVSAWIYHGFIGGLRRNINAARDRKESNMIRAFGRLSNIQKLEIKGSFIQYLADGPIPVNHPAVFFNHLADISVCLYIQPNEISAALVLFESAPNLENLSIKFMTKDCPNVEATAAWEVKAIQDHLFKHLKVVKIEYESDSDLSLQNTRSMLEFARLVLSTSPVLEELNFLGLRDAVIIFEMLKWLPKLSKNAEISFA